MRPADWSAAGFAGDPVPGSPDDVRRGGNSYLDIARTIDDTARGLRTLDLDGTVSEAIDALAETARTVADDIAKAEARYRATGNALVSYSAALASAQDDSLAALHRAQAAQSDAEGAQVERRRYLRLSEDATDPADALRYDRLADSAGTDARHASAVANAAHQDILDAARRRDAAAESARDDIENTTSGDDLNDSWWDDWGKDVLSVITDVAGTIAGIAGILALVVSWIPVIGQALAAALLLVAGIAAVINAIGNIVLAATGDRSWGEAIVSIIGAALAMIGIGGALRAVVGTAKATAGRINAIARLQPGFKAEVNTVRWLDVVKKGPRAADEAETRWLSSLPEVREGTIVYRLHGVPPGEASPALPTGASWGFEDPRGLVDAKNALGLPHQNAATDLLIARVTDPTAAADIAGSGHVVRHALPLDGNLGGGAEVLFPGPFGPDKGITVIDEVIFRVP